MPSGHWVEREGLNLGIGIQATGTGGPRGCIDSTSPVVVQRVSIRILRPSVQPSFSSPSRNAAKRACPRSRLSAANGMSTPTRFTRSLCCARAASGQAAAAPPSKVMKSRRFMSSRPMACIIKSLSLGRVVIARAATYLAYRRTLIIASLFGLGVDSASIASSTSLMLTI
jgi:hypothetical protein